MINFNSLVSLLLLLIYSVGLSFVLMPHNHSVEQHNLTHSSDSIHHQHHQHEPGDADHQHVKHDNHFDHNFFDYVLCLLSDIEHAAGADHQHLLVKKNTKKLLKISDKTSLTYSNHLDFFSNDFNKIKSKFGPKPLSKYLTPPIYYRLVRGPPTTV